jgi:hypothetical protein
MARWPAVAGQTHFVPARQTSTVAWALPVAASAYCLVPDYELMPVVEITDLGVSWAIDLYPGSRNDDSYSCAKDRNWPLAAFAGDENIANSMTAFCRVADVHQG